MKIILSLLILIVILKKSFRKNDVIQKITGGICNFLYYAVQYVVISPMGFLLNILKILMVYIKDDIVHGKRIYKREEFEGKSQDTLPDPSPDDTCPDEKSLF